jgi:hypothetical protein
LCFLCSFAIFACEPSSQASAPILHQSQQTNLRVLGEVV